MFPDEAAGVNKTAPLRMLQPCLVVDYEELCLDDKKITVLSLAFALMCRYQIDLFIDITS